MKDPTERVDGLQAISFGDFRLDLTRQELILYGEPVPLRRKTWETLLYLARRPGVLVTTHELLDAVWPDTAVTPSTLTNVISELRGVLDDRGDTPRIIATVHRRGYRFIAEIGATVAVEPVSRPESLRLDEGDSIGRAAEMAALREHWQQALGGRRQIVFVAGDPGIGKTTLVSRFVASCRESAAPPRVARAACVDQTSLREAYMPVLEMIEEIASSDPAVVALLRQYAPTWLAQMLALLPAQEMQALRLSLAGGGSERMLREGVMFFDALAAQRPLLLVIEDLHWSDPATIDLIVAMARRPQLSRWMAVLTYRPVEAVVRSHPVGTMARQLRLQRYAAQLTLPPFSSAEVRSYLTSRFGDSIADRLVPLIEPHSGGNPLFVSAIADHLIETGRLTADESGWNLVESTGEEIGLPDELRTMIGSQLEALSHESRTLLAAGAVEGEELSARVVAAATGLPQLEVEDALHTLALRHHLISPVTDRPWPDGHAGSRYRFRHALYRRALLEGISRSHLHQLHQRIGLCLEAVYGERAPEIATTLLTHFEACDDVERRVRYRALVGTAATLRFAYEDALRHFDEALVQVQRLPESPERWRQQANLELAIANSGILAGGNADIRVLEAFQRAEASAREAGAPRERFRALLGVSGVLQDLADVRAFGAAVDQLGELGPELPTLEAQIWWRRGEAAYWRCELVEAREALERSLTSRGEASVPVIVDHRSVVLARLSAVLTLLGEFDAATRAREGALRRAEEYGGAFNKCFVFWLCTIPCVLSQQAEKAWELSRRCEAALQEYDFGSFRQLPSWTIALGRIVDGVPGGLAEALEGSLRNAGRAQGTVYMTIIAQEQLSKGDPVSALNTIAAALDESEQTGILWMVPELLRLKGEVMLAEASPGSGRGRRRPVTSAEAEACFRESLAVSRRAHAGLWQLRTGVSLARYLARNNRKSEARELLAPIYGSLAAAGAETRLPDLEAASSLLKELSPPPSGSPTEANAPTRRSRTAPTTRTRLGRR